MVGGTFVRGRSTPSYVTLACSGVPRKGDKIRSCYFIRAFSGARKWAKLLRYPCVLGDLQLKGTKREVAAEPLPLQSTFMMSHGEKRKKQSQTFNHHCPPLPHIHHQWDLNPGPMVRHFPANLQAGGGGGGEGVGIKGLARRPPPPRASSTSTIEIPTSTNASHTRTLAPVHAGPTHQLQTQFLVRVQTSGVHIHRT